MALVDLLLIALLVVAGYTGSRRGAIQQLSTYLGLGVGLLAGTLLAPRLAALAEGTSGQAQLAVGTLLVFGAIGDAAGWFIGARLRRRVTNTRLRGADTVGGSLVSVGAVLLVVWFLALNLVTGPVPAVSRQIQRSTIVRGLAAALPEPPSLIGEARRFLNVLGFPDVFLGLPPPPSAPVVPPTDEEARAAFDAAAGSTVQVVEPACDQIQEGSGFAVERDLVVTNAHVVAGGDTPRVRVDDGPSLAATTVVFDSALDIAVLRVPGLPAAPSRCRPPSGGAAPTARSWATPRAGPSPDGERRSEPSSTPPDATSTGASRSSAASTSCRPSCGRGTAAGRSSSRTVRWRAWSSPPPRWIAPPATPSRRCRSGRS